MNEVSEPPKKYWFKRKTYGWGWQPASVEGWLVTAAYVGFVLFLVFRLEENISNEQMMQEFFAPFFVSVILFIVIAWKTGEELKWQWGNKKDQ